MVNALVVVGIMGLLLFGAYMLYDSSGDEDPLTGEVVREVEDSEIGDVIGERVNETRDAAKEKIGEEVNETKDALKNKTKELYEDGKDALIEKIIEELEEELNSSEE